MIKINSYVDAEDAAEIIKNGGMIIMTDNEDRENEGDLVQAAEMVTSESVNFMAAHGKGLICVPVDQSDADRLSLVPMTEENDSFHTTAFTVSVDLKHGIESGISASDRTRTIRKIADPSSVPSDFVRPGHIFPLVARKGGVLARNGHTEGSLDLVKLAGLKPAAVICEIMDSDGTMARGERLDKYAQEHGLKILSITRLADYLKLKKENDFIKVALPTRFGSFDLYVEEGKTDEQAAIFSIVKQPLDINEPVYVRIHSECKTGDILHSLKCDCGEQLEYSMKFIAQHGGVLIYLKQEGRGIGFMEKIKAYRLQENGADTVDANLMLGHEADARDYCQAALILKKMGIKKVRLLTNNPLKLDALRDNGFDEVARIPVEIKSNIYNFEYIKTKKEKMGHLLSI